MLITAIITAKMEVNKALPNNDANWYHKGMFIFHIQVDTNTHLCFGESELIDVFKKTVEKQNTNMERYTFDSYKYNWDVPSDITGDFNTLFKEHYNNVT